MWLVEGRGTRECHLPPGKLHTCFKIHTPRGLVIRNAGGRFPENLKRQSEQQVRDIGQSRRFFDLDTPIMKVVVEVEMSV